MKNAEHESHIFPCSQIQQQYSFGVLLNANHNTYSTFLHLQCCIRHLFLATHPLKGVGLVHLFCWLPTCLGLFLTFLSDFSSFSIFLLAYWIQQQYLMPVLFSIALHRWISVCWSFFWDNLPKRNGGRDLFKVSVEPKWLFCWQKMLNCRKFYSLLLLYSDCEAQLCRQ